MDISKEKALDIIEFLIDSEELNLLSFKLSSKTNSAVQKFDERYGKILKYINISNSTEIDFTYHLVLENIDLIENKTLSVDNIIVPKLQKFVMEYTVVVNKTDAEYWRDTFDGYSEKSIYYSEENGDWYPTDGEFIDSETRDSEIADWWYDSVVPYKKEFDNVNESKISNQDKVEKLIKMKKIIENKIKELS
jgi:hypothetical protein